MTTRCGARPGATRASRSRRRRRLASRQAKRSRSPTSWRSGRWRRICWKDLQSGLPRVFVQVQNGCDHRCTFCIIPYGRGNSRSVPMGAVVDQVRALVERGHAEIVLTGVDLTSYGADLPGAPKLGAADKADLAACAGTEAAADFVDRFDRGRSRSARRDRGRRAADAASASVAAVGRRSDPEADEAAAFAAPTRSSSARRCGGCGRTSRSAPISSRAFRPRPRRCSRARMDLVEECGLTFLHVFPYSPRPGTPAARMPQVAGDAIKRARQAVARDGRGGAAEGGWRRRSARRARC